MEKEKESYGSLFCCDVATKKKTMTEREKDYAKKCARENPHAFYCWARWEKVRAAVLAYDRYECQTCRHKYHRYKKATTVHHVNHLKDHPELALEMWYHDPITHKKERNLISLCHDCHEEAHGYRCRKWSEPGDPPLTEERWD